MAQKRPHVIALHEIPADGLALDLDLSGELVRAALAETEADPESARLRAELTLRKVYHDVHLRGRLDGELVLPCSRCTAAARFAVDVPFEMTLAPAPEAVAATGEEIELSEPDLDFATFENDEIDVGEILREQLILALPIAHLCRDECKGLCARCGKDLNEGPCQCPPEPPADDRWAGLRNVKL